MSQFKLNITTAIHFLSHQAPCSPFTHQVWGENLFSSSAITGYRLLLQLQPQLCQTSLTYTKMVSLPRSLVSSSCARPATYDSERESLRSKQCLDLPVKRLLVRLTSSLSTKSRYTTISVFSWPYSFPQICVKNALCALSWMNPGCSLAGSINVRVHML